MPSGCRRAHSLFGEGVAARAASRALALDSLSSLLASQPMVMLAAGCGGEEGEKAGGGDKGKP